jgi:hypothetical protein
MVGNRHKRSPVIIAMLEAASRGSTIGRVRKQPDQTRTTFCDGASSHSLVIRYYASLRRMHREFLHRRAITAERLDAAPRRHAGQAGPPPEAAGSTTHGARRLERQAQAKNMRDVRSANRKFASDCERERLFDFAIYPHSLA